MSTLNTATFGSDDEDDQDFVLPSEPAGRQTGAKKRRRGSDAHPPSGFDSDDDGEDADDDELNTEARRLKQEAEDADVKRRKEETERLFKSMLDDEPVTKPKETVQREMVQVKRPRQFAGETVYETMSLPKDHPDVVAYLERQKQEGQETATGPAAASQAASENADKPDLPPANTLPNHAPAPSLASAPAEKTAKGKAPLRRKPRQSLEAMSAALDKGKKMTTLEKSQMDWKSHTAADPSVQAELELNRRGGGFLDKQEFLDRVGQRRTGALDAQGRR